MIENFTVAVPDSVLADLRLRLARTRWPDDVANDDWGYGTNGAYLRELTKYWLNEFDWRRHEREINRFSHYRTSIDGVPIHFIREPGKGPAPMPLIMTHGWPWTFWDLHKVIRPLAGPGAYGGDPSDAFDVIVPSLPGFAFSTPLTEPGFPYWRTADLWVKLMREELGYDRFGAQGGDYGAFVTAQLGHKYAAHMTGIHVHLVGPLGMIRGNMPDRSVFGPGEEKWYDANQHFFDQEGAYSALQATKPQTLAYGMADSPVGMCSWILEKRRRWSDCGGMVERRFTKDELLTTMTLYWATESFGTAARSYADAKRYPWQPSHDRSPVVEAQTGVLLFENDIVKLPRGWAERYYNLERWNVALEGGHFAPMEEPEVLVRDLRAFFSELR